MKVFPVVMGSDIHIPTQQPVLWAGFKSLIKDIRPRKVVLMGDIIDFPMLSSYVPSEGDPLLALPPIKMAIREINWIARYAGEVHAHEGNHDERWAKAILKPHAQKLVGLKGLTLKEQMYAQGLNPAVQWTSEGTGKPGLFLGKRALLAQHGHKQASKWGVVHVAQKGLVEQPTISTVRGHHHRAQLMCRTTIDGVTVSIALPCMTNDHDYQILPNWQRGFAIFEFFGGKTLETCPYFTPHLIIANAKGQFSYGGKVYG